MTKTNQPGKNTQTFNNTASDRLLCERNSLWDCKSLITGASQKQVYKQLSGIIWYMWFCLHRGAWLDKLLHTLRLYFSE